MRFIPVLFAAMFAFHAFAQEPAKAPVQTKPTGAAKVKPADMTNPPIRAGTEITVNDYHKDTDVFMVTMTAEPDIGPNFASSSALHKALEHEGSLKDFVKNKDQLIGSIFTLKKELPLIEGEDLVKKYKKIISNRKK